MRLDNQFLIELKKKREDFKDFTNMENVSERH